MNARGQKWPSRVTPLLVGTLMAGILCLGRPAATVQADVITLTHQNSTVEIDPNSQAGVYKWEVDGTNQLRQHWLWYRIGDANGQTSLGSLPYTIEDQLSRSIVLQFTDPGGRFTLEISYQLAGGQAGSLVSGLTEGIKVNNTSGSTLDLHLFEYANFDLSGDPNGDTATMKNSNTVDQTKLSTTWLCEASVTGQSVSHYEAALYPTTLNRLNSGSPIALLDSNQAGPGDATWAIEWDVDLGPSGSLILSKAMTISPAPEPGTVALLALGAVGVLCRRRRARARE